MCLIVVAWKMHPDFPLVVAANRDEFHARSTATARFWDDRPEILAGRDLEGMGTWLGVTRSGKFAAVTNYRDAAPAPQEAASRGLLASRYLESGEAPREFAANAGADGDAYRGFNLLAGDRAELWWVSNRGGRARRIEPGLHGLSNHLLDTPWPKVTLANHLDKNGNVKSTDSVTREILILYGRRMEHILERNDKPLSPEEQKKEDARFDKAVDKLQKESPADRQKRIEKFEEDSRKAREFVTEVANAFNFKFEGVDTVNGRPAYIISGTPRSDYHPSSREGRILSKTRGKMWID